MAELNPGFSFDFGGGDDDIQAPWEFEGALAQTEEHVGASNATSIDYKIAQQLARSKRPGVKARKDRKPAKAAVSSDSEEEQPGSSSEEEDGGSDSDDDVPLPGELDDESDEEEGEAGGSSEEEEEEEASEDEIAKAGMELDADDLHGSSEEEEEGGDDDVEEAEEQQQHQQAAPIGKRKREAQQAPPEQKPRRGAAGAPDGQQQQQEGGEEAAGKKRKGFFDSTPKETKFSATSFADLGLSRPLLKACAALGYASPTPIQAACIPLAMAGRDICGSAVTGSGKTAAFGLPTLERLLHRDKRLAATYVLVLTPVRELAVQVHSMIQKLAQFTDIRTALVVGGLSLQAQAATLRSQPEVVVATPGRMIDHLRNSQSVGLEELAVLVLDEADRLLEMGFAEEVREVVRMAPVKRQTMLFSATMTEEVRKLVALSLNHPVRLAADAAASAPKELSQEVVRLKGGAVAAKEAALLALCSRTFSGGRTIIFAKTKQRAHRLKMLFGLAGLPPAVELHGDMTQAARLDSLERFRKGEAAFLLATELAARGLDILGVETVINFDAPAHLASYLHRVGRTARAGAKGRALTFAEDDDRQLLKEIVKKAKAELLQRQVPAAAVSSWQARIEALEPQVAAIVQEEREERLLRKAEMEAQKASNMLEHEAEIYSRPARTWFQTEKQKRELAKKAKEAAAEGGGGSDDEDGGLASMTNKQKKNKAKNEKRLEMKKQRGKEAAAGGRKKNRLMEETKEASRSIRAVKAREQRLRLEGMTGGKAGKVAASLVTGVKRKKQKKGKKDGQQGPKRELFEGDGLGPSKPTGGGSKVYSGGARSGKVKPPRSGGKLAKSELNRVKRGGKGKHGFKSKAKHRRR